MRLAMKRLFPNIVLKLILFILFFFFSLNSLNFANNLNVYRYELFFKDGNLPYDNNRNSFISKDWFPINHNRKLRCFSFGKSRKTLRTEPFMINNMVVQIESVDLKQIDEKELIPVQLIKEENTKSSKVCAVEFLYDDSNSHLIITLSNPTYSPLTIPISNQLSEFEKIYNVTPGQIDLNTNHYLSNIIFLELDNVTLSDMIMISYPSPWVRKYIHLKDDINGKMFSKNTTLDISQKKFEIINTCCRHSTRQKKEKNCFLLKTDNLQGNSFSGIINFSQIFPDLKCPSMKNLKKGVCRNITLNAREVVRKDKIEKILFSKHPPNLLFFIPGCFDFKEKETINKCINALSHLQFDLEKYNAAGFYYFLTKDNIIATYDIDDHEKIDHFSWKLIEDIFSSKRNIKQEFMIKQLSSKSLKNKNYDTKKTFINHLNAFLNDYLYQNLKNLPQNQVKIDGNLHFIFLLPNRFSSHKVENAYEYNDLLRLCMYRNSFLYFHFVFCSLEEDSLQKSVQSICNILNQKNNKNDFLNKSVYFYNIDKNRKHKPINNANNDLIDISNTLRAYRNNNTNTRLLLKNDQVLSIPSIFDWDIISHSLQVRSTNNYFINTSKKTLQIPINVRFLEETIDNNIIILPRNLFKVSIVPRSDIIDDLKLFVSNSISLTINIKQKLLTNEAQRIDLIKYKDIELEPVKYYQKRVFIIIFIVLIILLILLYIYSFIYTPELFILDKTNSKIPETITIPLNKEIELHNKTIVVKRLIILFPRTQILQIKINQSDKFYPLWHISEENSNMRGFVCNLSEIEEFVRSNEKESENEIIKSKAIDLYVKNWVRNKKESAKIIEDSHTSESFDDASVMPDDSRKIPLSSSTPTNNSHTSISIIFNIMRSCFLWPFQKFFPPSINLYSFLGNCHSRLLFGGFIIFFSLLFQYFLVSFEIRDSHYYVWFMALIICFFGWDFPLFLCYILKYKIENLKNIELTLRYYGEIIVVGSIGIIAYFCTECLKVLITIFCKLF